MSVTTTTSPSPRRSRLPVLIPLLLVSLLALAAVTYTLPYYALAPGSSRPVHELVELPAHLAFPNRGRLLMTTVSLKEVTPFEAFRGWLHRDVDVVPFQRLTGTKPTKEARRQLDADLRRSMGVSRHVAVTVVLRRLGLDEDRQDELARQIRVDPGELGGGSAGLALALGLLDLLTAGDLTGGHRVAVTGSILPNASVGDVEGVGQKAAAARSVGAEFLLVPPGGVSAARARAGTGLEVLEVATLDEAVAALVRVGGVLGEPRRVGGMQTEASSR